MLSLIHVVEWRAAVTGDQVALSDHLGGELTYGDLAAEVERSAARYAAAGIGPGEVVPIIARNQVGWVTAVLGLIRLGALPAAVNWRLAPPEVSTLLALIRAGAVVSTVVTDADCEPLVKQALAGLAGAEPGVLRLDEPAGPVTAGGPGQRPVSGRSSGRWSGCAARSPACCCTPAARQAGRSWCR